MSILAHTTSLPQDAVVIAPNSWSYETAFARHRGLINEAEQEELRGSCIAIAGMGGVGGIHLATLARLGIGFFHIADPDTFELANFNRQYGADTSSIGRSKAEVMAEKALAINPELKIQCLTGPVTQDNVVEFLEGVDILVDGIDFFGIESRRMIFNEARRRGIWSVTAGPIGFGTASIVFDPNGMSFDQYFDIQPGMDRLDQLIAFAVGLAPKATHLSYLDLKEVSITEETGPSAALACHLASGVASAEVLKIILGRGPIRPAPCYQQFDAYRQLLCRKRLRWGNRHPLQRLKRWILRKKFAGAVTSQLDSEGSREA